MSLFENGRRIVHTYFPAQAKEVYDVTGAGDTVIGVLALCLAAKANLKEATCLANLAASIVVGKIGTSTVSRRPSSGRRRLAHRRRGADPARGARNPNFLRPLLSRRTDRSGRRRSAPRADRPDPAPDVFRHRRQTEPRCMAAHRCRETLGTPASSDARRALAGGDRAHLRVVRTPSADHALVPGGSGGLESPFRPDPLPLIPE